MDGKADVTIALCTPDGDMMLRWRDFIEDKTLATVTIAASRWVDVIAHPRFPPDIAMMAVDSSSLLALRRRTHVCRQLGILVILADPDHVIDEDSARSLDVLFVMQEESDADRALAAVRADQVPRTGQ